MKDEKTVETDVELEDATTEDEEVESEEAEDEDVEQESSELDLDAEIEAEKKHGEPDPEKAREAFEKREAKRKARELEEDDEDDEDRPLTQKDLARVEERVRRQLSEERIGELANELVKSPKEAELIVAMHKNRSFPSSMPLREQLAEMADLVEAKKLRAKNGELARALKSKSGVSKKAESTHRDTQVAVATKLAPDMALALKQGGFEFDPKQRAYSRKFGNGKTELFDPKTKQSQII